VSKLSCKLHKRCVLPYSVIRSYATINFTEMSIQRSGIN